MQNPKAYNGSEPYIFISYAHKDDELVYPIITKMQNDGYRVWYDEGITPATVWAKNIAKRITDCSFFIAFVSTNYLNSDNCLNELDYGYKKCNHRLLIHLENINLPEDIDMNWGRIQALLKHKYIEDVDFYKDLYSSKCISNTKSSAGSFAISLDNGDVYTGDVNNDGKFHGNGTMKYADGSLYTGEWRDNKRNGKGCIKYANGNSYDGEWRDDKRNGHGVFNTTFAVSFIIPPFTCI